MKLPELTIGRFKAKIPIVQGGMSVRVSTSSLAAAVAECGGIGTIGGSGIPIDELAEDIRKAKRMTRGVVAVNIMFAVKQFMEAVKASIDAGVDMIKLSMEDGYAGQSGLPKLTDEELDAIISASHERGALVSGHITQVEYLEILVEAGVDDIAHITYDVVSDETWREMVEKDIYMTPTFTVFKNYGAPISTCVPSHSASTSTSIASSRKRSSSTGDFSDTRTASRM